MRLTILIFGLFIFSSLYSQVRKEIVNTDYSVFIDPSGVYKATNFVSDLNLIASNRYFTIGLQRKISEKKFIQIPLTLPISLSYKNGDYTSSKNTVMYYYYYSDIGAGSPTNDKFTISSSKPCPPGSYSCHGQNAIQENFRIKDLVFQTGLSYKFYPLARRKFSFFTQISCLTGLMNIYQFDYYHTLKMDTSQNKWRISSETKQISNDLRFFLRPELLLGFSTRFWKKITVDLSLGLCPRIKYHSQKKDEVFLRYNDSEYESIYLITKVPDNFDEFGSKQFENYFNLLARFSIYYNFNWKKDE